MRKRQGNMRRHRREEKDEEEEEEEEEEANILLLYYVQVQKTQAVIHTNSNNSMLRKHLQVLGH